YSSDRIAQNVAEYLSGIGGSGTAGFGANRVRSLADAVARVIREHEAAKQLASGTRNQESGIITEKPSSNSVVMNGSNGATSLKGLTNGKTNGAASLTASTNGAGNGQVL